MAKKDERKKARQRNRELKPDLFYVKGAKNTENPKLKQELKAKAANGS